MHLDSQITRPGPDAAALAGPTEPPRVCADHYRRLVHLHCGGDVAFVVLTLSSIPAACVGGVARAAAAGGSVGSRVGDVGVTGGVAGG